ncbi:MAG TPA: glycerophosphodiester phosphodiesterase [Candidatus Saccharimonadales bacterium]|nr:glycerophosphodiester phosphodiesterase [Candidatus Saccharimonadales bacterium]
MTKLIGHRGAAGLALENSTESIRAALLQDVNAVEFDVHLTSDNKIVVLHDSHTGRVAKKKMYVRETTLTALQHIKLKNGQHIPTLDEVLDILGDKPIIIDIKDEGSAEELLNVLDRHPKADISFASFKHNELRILRAARPDRPIYVLEHVSPIEIINTARALGADGVGLNKWLMNPLTYHLAERYGLELYVYTLNSPLLGNFFKKLYPKVHICTDHPERFRR